MPKRKAAATPASTAKAKPTKRVIAVQSYPGHPYGHEFEMEEGAELDTLIKKGTVRLDDRMGPPAPSAAPSPPAEGPTT